MMAKEVEMKTEVAGTLKRTIQEIKRQVKRDEEQLGSLKECCYQREETLRQIE